TMPRVAPEAVYSFLKDTRGLLSWRAHDLEETLAVDAKQASQILALLQMQGYIAESSERGQWMTTAAGEAVSGSKTPRLRREKVEAALVEFADRIRAINRDKGAEFRIVEATVFGDFLSRRPLTQKAELGIGLRKRNSAPEGEAAADRKSEDL